MELFFENGNTAGSVELGSPSEKKGVRFGLEYSNEAASISSL